MKMFGGVSFMVDERMLVAVRNDGELLLRIDPADSERLLDEPGAHEALMGADRPMGAGWISVRSDVLEGPGLGEWLGRALAFHAGQAGG
ncbi:hypothetical protein FM104_03065 [Microbacterium esteraromaticum]|uniref:TfoX N-terminal domain-containing protein n=1 Tax=Microbacterium esteraromaticum TaxID=57043 RepID=A0A1R4INR8_9MICO|nr:hypothetical protein FM104_03065 [Microbacterium esteraromaticum]